MFFCSSSRLLLPEIRAFSQILKELARNVRHPSAFACASGTGPLINSLFGLNLAHVFLFRTGTKEGACMVIGSHLTVCAVFEILVVLVPGLRHPGALPESAHASIDALVVTRTESVSIIALVRAWHRRCAVRATRLGIRPVRRRNHDGPLDRHDHGKRIDRAEPSRHVLCVTQRGRNSPPDQSASSITLLPK